MAPKPSRDTLLNQPRSGARPLGGSAGPQDGPSSTSSTPRSRFSGSSSSSTPPASPSARSSTTPARSSARTSTAGAKPAARSSPASSSSKGKGKGRTGLPRSKGQPGQPVYRNYQAIILAEFVAAELLTASTPIATRKGQPGLSPYVPKDLVQLAAIGFVFLILELIAVGGRGAGRVAAWIGALVLLTVGLSEAANIAKVFALLSGGSGKPSTDAITTTAAHPDALTQVLQTTPGIGTTEGTSSAPPGGAGTRSGSAFVQEAAKFIGTPYQWGGAAPGGFDCSGLVQYALEKLGLRNVPRTSEEQWAWVQHIPESQLAPGDLIFEQWPGEASPGHVAIYSGRGQIIQAPAPGQNVQRDKWSPSIVHGEGGQIVGYGRVPGLNSLRVGATTAGEGSGGKL